MPAKKLSRDALALRSKAIESLTLAIELFNRPSEVGRHHGVLILLQHAFEMILKASILHRTGKVHDDDGRYTYGFEKCLAICEEQLKTLSVDERATLQILDAQRDQVTHYYVELSEDVLYVHAQSSVTLFASYLQEQFSLSLPDLVPARVLPVSTIPPQDIVALFTNELASVDKLLGSGRRQGAKAAARLRSILAFAAGSRPGGERVATKDLTRAINRRRKSEDWEVILPEVAQLRLNTEGTGIPVSVRISKDAPLAVRVAKPGEEVVGTLLKQEVNLWDVFSLSRDDLADKLGLTAPRTHALIYELEIQKDPQCYRELRKKSTVFKGYSAKALEKLRAAKDTLDMDAVWKRHRPRLVPTARR